MDLSLWRLPTRLSTSKALDSGGETMRLYKLNVEVGAGKWDSWGLSLSYCHYDHSLAIDFIHWYAYIAVYLQKDKEEE
jgi:hypothetical protein